MMNENEVRFPLGFVIWMVAFSFYLGYILWVYLYLVIQVDYSEFHLLPVSYFTKSTIFNFNLSHIQTLAQVQYMSITGTNDSGWLYPLKLALIQATSSLHHIYQLIIKYDYKNDIFFQVIDDALPSIYWATSIPAFICVFVIFVFFIHIGLVFTRTLDIDDPKSVSGWKINKKQLNPTKLRFDGQLYDVREDQSTFPVAPDDDEIIDSKIQRLPLSLVNEMVLMRTDTE